MEGKESFYFKKKAHPKFTVDLHKRHDEDEVRRFFYGFFVIFSNLLTHPYIVQQMHDDDDAYHPSGNKAFRLDFAKKTPVSLIHVVQINY